MKRARMIAKLTALYCGSGYLSTVRMRANATTASLKQTLPQTTSFDLRFLPEVDSGLALWLCFVIRVPK